MGNLPFKLRAFFLPFILLGIGCIGTYTFIHWLLVVKYDLIHIRESITTVLLPVLLVIFAVIFFLGSHLSLLDFKHKWMKFVYQAFAIITLSVCTVSAQYYMITDTGKLTDLATIDHIINHKPSKYYTLKDYFVAKDQVRYYFSENRRYRVKQKDRKTELYVYTVAPIFNNAAEASSKQNVKGWIGIAHNTTNRSRNVSEHDEKHFIDKSLKEFASSDFQNIVYFERISTDLDKFKTAVNKGNEQHLAELVILKPKYESLANRNQKFQNYTFITFGVAIIGWLLMIVAVPVNERKLNFINRLKQRSAFVKA